MTVFLSTYCNKLDKKGRVSVPAPFRLLLEASGFSGFVAYPSFLHPCIEACSLKRMEVLAHGIEQLDPFSEERHAFAAAILTESVPVPFDGDGRVVVPDALLAPLGTTEQLLFAGKGSTFEIWHPDAFAAHAKEAKALAFAKRDLLRAPLLNASQGGTV
jgi:MraZ protein